MKIPDYILFVGSICGKTDTEIEQLWGEFCRAKFLVLESRKLRQVFFAIFCLFGYGGAVKVCNQIKKLFRIPKTIAIIEFEHEHVLWYLNTIDENTVDKLILSALINTQNDIAKLRMIVNLIIQKKQEHKEKSHGNIINFI